jgi:twitching motility protein PilT
VSALLDVRFADIVHSAQRESASDVHLVPDVRATMRVDGELQCLAGSPFTAIDVNAIAASLFTPSQVSEIEDGHDVSTTWTDGDGLTMRIHGLRATGGIALAVRVLHRSIPTIGELRLPATVSLLSKRQHGLVLFCGPTGSGKSTSLAALVGEINRTQSRRILTIEDPVEYRHTSDRSLITQREVGRDAASFASAVLGALRADPDVIVIGEIRDPKTISAALTAAETGHLVLTTLHAGGAVQAIDRIVDSAHDTDRAYVRAQLAASLSAVVCQRLLPHAHGRGRRPVTEILIATDGIRSMIRDGRTHLIQNAIATGRSVGMQSLDQHLEELSASGEISAIHAREARA